MATSARAFRCDLIAPKTTPSRRIHEASQIQVPARVSSEPSDGNKIVLQPRLCTLRSYGGDPVAAAVKTKPDGGGDTAPFFEALSEYIESSKKSQDFEIISGRLAMIVFAATVATESATGNSVFAKADLQGIEEAGGACLAAVTLAAVFAWFSSARNRVGNMFTVGCSSFIDGLIDQIVDGLFYESESSEWSDDS